MRNIHPVEELAEIRAEMRQLKAREAELRRYFLSEAAPACEGPFHRVDIRRQRARVFDKTRLPQVILSDPRFYKDRVSDVVKVQPVMAHTPLPGLSDGWGDDIDLIEPCH
ncbi:hypothetical protein [Aliiroseovarius subalbicans]|uniref:hypothetical protein n=1 Tax=Aliiroseovarius subalbicans TaxID=2925840 RepID=UPI001F5ADD00|nr:hypothetical protein [Aliiroseovarius subalbicans]MCI2398856.1 hypothetical protein [Aliiroseovarius subalbicans]